MPNHFLAEAAAGLAEAVPPFAVPHHLLAAGRQAGPTAAGVLTGRSSPYKCCAPCVCKCVCVIVYVCVQVCMIVGGCVCGGGGDVCAIALIEGYHAGVSPGIIHCTVCVYIYIYTLYH